MQKDVYTVMAEPRPERQTGILHVKSGGRLEGEKKHVASRTHMGAHSAGYAMKHLGRRGQAEAEGGPCTQDLDLSFYPQGTGRTTDDSVQNQQIE